MASSWEGGRKYTIYNTHTESNIDRQTDRQADELTNDPLNLSDMLKQLVL